jgi:hypothetical protein
MVPGQSKQEARKLAAPMGEGASCALSKYEQTKLNNFA